MRQKERKKRTYFIVGLCFVFVLMIVGYAAYSTNLVINGTSQISSNWCVGFDSSKTDDYVASPVEEGKSDPIGNINFAGNECGGGYDTGVNLSTSLNQPGDKVVYTLTIVNKSSLRAVINSIKVDDEDVNVNTTKAKGNVVFKVKMPKKTALDANETTTMSVIVEFQNSENITGTYGGERQEISIGVNSSQGEEGITIEDELYTLTYNCTENGGTGSQTLSYKEGSNVDLTVNCTKTGYRFLGWNTNKDASTVLSNYTMPDKNNTLYAIYEQMAPTIDLIETSHTTSSITVNVNAHDNDYEISKYEFSKDNGATWIDNGTNSTYTFNGLTKGQTYNIKVRVTNEAGGKTTSESKPVIPNVPVPTFIESITKENTTVEITYPEECLSSEYTCTYQKDSEQAVTVDTKTAEVSYTASGTLIATVSDGDNTVSSTYTVTYLVGDNVTGEETYSTAGSTTFTAPADGDYYLQVWGAQGGAYSSYGVGGKGGYSYGTITLNKGDTLYINTGGQGSYGATSTYTLQSGGGTNGGGSAGYRGGGGGGASDIRVNSDSLYARVIVAGGGGGAYSFSSAYKANGGYGGGENGGNGSTYFTSSVLYTKYAGLGGTQSAGGAGGESYSSSYSTYYGKNGTFGVGGNTGYKYNSTSYYSSGAGGSGWYGGGGAGNYYSSSRNYAAGGGGGSGYVYNADTVSNYPSGCLLDSSYYLKDAATVAGNTSFESPSGGEEIGHSGDGYVKISYDITPSINDKSTLAVNSVTTNSISVTAAPKSGLAVSKYEFSSDNGSTWINNGSSGTYTFTGLTHNTTYNIKVRLTTSDGKVVNSTKAKTHEIVMPTISDSIGTNSINSTVMYPEGCGSTFTCTYKKNTDSPVTVTSTSEVVNFTSQGTLTAIVSDGTNVVATEIHEVEESEITLSFSTSKTTKSITVTDTASAPTGVAKYEFQVDGGAWVESANNVYTFSGLSNSISHTVNSRVISNFGTVKTGTAISVTLNSITLPTYKAEYRAVDDADVTITYPSGCGSTYTCTYIKNSENPETVTSKTTVVNYSADGELAASVSDGTNTVANSFTVTMPLDVINDYGPKMLVVGAGDGLYMAEEGTDDTAYFYRGANPSNYLNLGGDMYRIMGIDSSGNLKVIRSTVLSLVHDSGYSTSISGITSSSSIAGTRYSSNSNDYCYTSSSSSYNGCNVWGSSASTLNSAGTSNVTQMPKIAGGSTLYNLPEYDSYINVYLNGGTYPTESGTTTLTSWYSSNVDLSVQSKIVDHLWNVGPASSDSSLTQAQTIEQEAAYKWRGKVGLMTATDYVRASTNATCTNLSSYRNNSACYNNSNAHNWLYGDYDTMTPFSSSMPNVWYVYPSGSLEIHYVYSASNVRPVFYLSSDIHLKGKGTLAEPYYVYTEPTNAAKATLTKLGQTAKEPYSNSGDGIYEDNAGGYNYRGGNPANYINLGSDLYRIMSIDSSGNLKVIKDFSLDLVWDPGYETNLGGITSSSFIDGTRYSSNSNDYCYTSSSSSYNGCKSWGSSASTLNSAGTSNVTQMPKIAGGSTLYNLPEYDSYINVYLNGGTYPTESGTTTLTSWYSNNVDLSVQSKIVDHLWNVGPVSNSSNYALAQNIGQEASYKWRGKVGLMTATDYVRASTNSVCRNVYYYYSSSSCYNNNSTHNWLNKSLYQWTMSSYFGSGVENVWYATSKLNYSGNRSASLTSTVRPVFYLSPDITISGTGESASNAFTVS